MVLVWLQPQPAEASMSKRLQHASVWLSPRPSLRDVGVAMHWYVPDYCLPWRRRSLHNVDQQFPAESLVVHLTIDGSSRPGVQRSVRKMFIGPLLLSQPHLKLPARFDFALGLPWRFQCTTSLHKQTNPLYGWPYRYRHGVMLSGPVLYLVTRPSHIPSPTMRVRADAERSSRRCLLRAAICWHRTCLG